LAHIDSSSTLVTVMNRRTYMWNVMIAKRRSGSIQSASNEVEASQERNCGEASRSQQKITYN